MTEGIANLNRSFQVGMMLVCCSALCACGPDIYPADQKHLELLEQTFGNHYKFDLIDNLVVVATSKTQEEPTLEEATRIYETFWMERNKRRETPFGILCIHDRRNRFRFGVNFDYGSQEFVVHEGEDCMNSIPAKRIRPQSGGAP